MLPFAHYPKIRNLGHPEVDTIFRGAVEVTEKIDGSQFSFGNIEGQLFAMSKRARIDDNNIPKMFAAAYRGAKKRFEAGILPEGVVFRGENLSRPKHNVLKYERVPRDNFILFDVMIGARTERYLQYKDIAEWAKKIDYEVVPLLFSGYVKDLEHLQKLAEEIKPVLGGEHVEGMVFKNYFMFNEYTGKPMFAKYVRPNYREEHSILSKNGKAGKPKATPREIGKAYANEVRWNKCLMRLQEEGRLTHSPKDIGLIIKEAQLDLEEEDKEVIKERLWKLYRRDIMTGAVRGIAPWYKELLNKKQFEEN